MLKQQRLAEIEEHLKESEGSWEQVDEIEPNYMSKRGDFDIDVTFKDEPNITYRYVYADRHERIVLSEIYEGDPPFKFSDQIEEGNHGRINGS